MALLGDQRKIDANKDGEITAKDFEMLREQRQSGGLLDDDMMRVGYANGTPDDGGERVMLMQQKAMQALIDASRNQYNQYANAPMNKLGLPLAALGAAPVPETQKTERQLGLMDYLTAGAQMYAGMPF